MNTNIANSIKDLRRIHGLTQAELATALGVGKSTVSMYEVGARIPDFEMLECIADYFNVNLMSLVRPNAEADTDEKEPTPEGERDYAQNEHEEEMLLLARHLEPIPEDERKKLVSQLKSFADLYLRSVLPQEDE